MIKEDLINKIVEGVKPYLEMFNPSTLWVLMNILIAILLIIVMFRLRIALKKIRGRESHKKEEKPGKIKEKPKEIKENKEIKKPAVNPPAEKKIIKPEKIIEKEIIRPERIIEREIIRPEKITGLDRFAGKKTKEDREMENLRRRIINIERKQRIRILEEMRKQIRSNRR